MLKVLFTFLAAQAFAQAPSPVDALTVLLAAKPETVQTDLTERLFGFMWDTAKGSTFIPAKRRKDPALAGKVREGVAAWVKAHAGSGEAASVFYVLGAGDKLPDWAKGDPVLSGSLSGFRKEDFLKKMAPWTEDSSGLPGQLSKKHAAKWPAAFLTDAASQARRFLDHRPIQDDQAYDAEGKRLSGKREPPRGEMELLRINKPKDIIPPSPPKMLKGLKKAINPIPPKDAADK